MKQQELRFTRRLVSFWESLATGADLPTIEQFHASVAADVWARCLEIVVTKRALVIKSMGEAMIEAHGGDLTGYRVETIKDDFVGFFIYNDVERVVLSQSPAEGQGYFGNMAVRTIAYRTCHLPFGNARDGVTHVVIGLSYKVLTL